MTITPTIEELKALFERLASAPRLLFEVCSGAPPERMTMPLAPGKWTPHQIIKHLTSCDREALLPRIEKMLAEDDPFLPGFDQDEWMKKFGDVRGSITVVLLDEYARLREKVSIMLFDLEPAQWLRPGRHEAWGPITIHSLCVHFAQHDEHHRKQIAAHLGRSIPD